MMENETLVYIELNGKISLVGMLWSRLRNNRESATFEYAKEWLNSEQKFALEPALQLYKGPQHTPERKALFGAIGDSAPDRWGRMLMRRSARVEAKQRNKLPKAMMEVDYLLQVSDVSRQGALRFAKQQGGPFLSDNKVTIPPLIKLPALLSATEKITEEQETLEEQKLLLAPGSSLGGARPKASVIDNNGNLSIAKFPHKDDEYCVMLWEALALELADKAGIRTPTWRIETVVDKVVLIIERFDRVGAERIPYLSAMSMLGANDNEQRSYLEIADAIRRFGSNVEEDLHELWRRMVFNIMIANTDDHLRNHGFLYQGLDGWQLSPAFDLNPVPLDIKPRILSTAIDFDQGKGDIKLALSVAEYFQLSQQMAKNIVQEVRDAVSNWKVEAKRLNIPNDQIKRMETAFLVG